MGKNEEIAEIFYHIADLLELENVQWKPIAYRKAARSLESLGEEVDDIYKRRGIKGIEEIPGVGERLAKKIVEYIETGKIKEWEKLKKSLPSGFHELLEVPGLGVKRAKLLYDKLKISSLSDLEKAAKEHKICKLPSFKEKTEQNILQGIQFLKKIGKEERKLLGVVLPIAKSLKEQVEKIEGVKRAEIAGSIRRMKETVRDIDILAAGNDGKITKAFTKLPGVERIIAQGPTRATAIVKGIHTDIRVIPENEFGSALQYFTGSKEHSIHLRKICIKKGLKLSEYGIFKGKKIVASKTEEDIYNYLKMPYIEPELREDRGEIEAALQNRLPKIVKYNEVISDLHCHTNMSDGNNTLSEMVSAAISFKRKCIAICDHGGKHLPIARALSEREVEKQIKEIDKLNQKLGNITILKGTEVDILANGKLSLPDKILKQLDIVTASVHSGFKFPKEKMTARVLKALDNPYLCVLGHPTGRIIFEREPYQIDLEKIFEKAASRGIAMEINAYPNRLDLNDTNVKLALEYGIKFAIGTDSHSIEHLKFLELGTAVARRGWVTAKDVLNAFPVDKLLKFLRK